MKFFIQLDADNIVRDCISYEYGDYFEVELPIPLPAGIIGGWFRWQEGALVYDQVLYDQVNKIPQMQAYIADLETFGFEQAYQVALLSLGGGEFGG